MISDPRSIENRSVVVETRERFEGWELDTVPGKHGTGALVTLAERKSRMCLVKRIDAKRAVDVRDAVIQMLKEPLIKSGASSLARADCGERSFDSRRRLRVKPAIVKICNTEADDLAPQDAAS